MDTFLLDFNQKLNLADLLLNCPSIQDPDTRYILLKELPHDIAGTIKANDNSRVHMLNVVNACTKADGLNELLDTFSRSHAPAWECISGCSGIPV